jgi:hypothetical protein
MKSNNKGKAKSKVKKVTAPDKLMVTGKEDTGSWGIEDPILTVPERFYLECPYLAECFTNMGFKNLSQFITESDEDDDDDASEDEQGPTIKCNEMEMALLQILHHIRIREWTDAYKLDPFINARMRRDQEDWWTTLHSRVLPTIIPVMKWCQYLYSLNGADAVDDINTFNAASEANIKGYAIKSDLLAKKTIHTPAPKLGELPKLKGSTMETYLDWSEASMVKLRKWNLSFVVLDEAYASLHRSASATVWGLIAESLDSQSVDKAIVFAQDGDGYAAWHALADLYQNEKTVSSHMHNIITAVNSVTCQSSNQFDTYFRTWITAKNRYDALSRRATELGLQIPPVMDWKTNFLRNIQPNDMVVFKQNAEGDSALDLMGTGYYIKNVLELSSQDLLTKPDRGAKAKKPEPVTSNAIAKRAPPKAGPNQQDLVKQLLDTYEDGDTKRAVSSILSNLSKVTGPAEASPPKQGGGGMKRKRTKFAGNTNFKQVTKQRRKAMHKGGGSATSDAYEPEPDLDLAACFNFADDEE